MNVLIIETKFGKVVANLPIVLRGQNYTPTEQEYFNHAWKSAGEDKTVDPNRRDEYTFKVDRPA